MKRDPVWTLIRWYIIVVLLALALIALCTSCQVLKGKRTIAKDSTAVAKADSGFVKKNESENSKQKDYERITYVYPPRDCVINKNYTYPSTVIYERGKEQEQSKQINYDSLWNNRLDSLSAKLSETTKTKETKVLSPLQIIGLCVLSFIALKLIVKFKLI